MKILTGIPLQQTTYTSSTTLGLNNAGKLLLMNGASTNSVTVPPNASVSFPIGTQIMVIQTSAIPVTFIAGAGVTINSDTSKLKLTAQYCGATLIKTDTNTWSLIGNLSA